MTKVPGIKYKQVGNLYGLRNWVEYGLKQSKNEQGKADFRVTDYSQIHALVVSGDVCVFDGEPSRQCHQSCSEFCDGCDSLSCR